MSAGSEELRLKYTLDAVSVFTNAVKMAQSMEASNQAAIKLAQSVKDLQGQLGRVETSLKKQQSTQAATARSLTNLNNRVRQNTKSVIDQKRRVGELTLSWRTFERYLLASLARRAVYAILAGIREGLREAIELEKRIAEISTISQNNQLPFDQWADGLREVSNAFGLDILGTAEAAYQALSNQVAEGAETFTFLAEASKFAITTVSSQADAVGLISAAINSFGKETSQADEIAASFFKTIELGRVRASELANSYGRISVAAGLLGVEMNELNALIDITTIRGLKANEALTQIRGLINSLIKPTDTMTKLIESWGYETAQQAIAAEGFENVLIRMNQATGDSAVEIAKLVPRIRGMTALMAVADDNAEGFRATLEELNTAQDSYARGAEIAANNTGRELDKIINSIRNFFIEELGRDVNQALADFSKTVVRLDAVLIGLLNPVRQGVRVFSLATATIIEYSAAVNTAISILDKFTVIVTAFKNSGLGLIISDIIDTATLLDTQERIRTIANETTRILKNKADEQLEDTKRAEDEKLAVVLRANKEIRLQLNNNVESYRASLESIQTDLKESFANAIKLVQTSVKGADSAIKDAQNRLKTLADDSADFIAGLREDIFRESIADLDLKDQIKGLSDEILRVQKQRQEAVASGETEIAQELLKRERDLIKERIKLDRDRVKEVQDLSEEEIELRRDAEQKLAELKDKLAEAEKSRDRKAAKAAEQQIRKLVDETREEYKQLREERDRLEDSSLGRFVNNATEQYQRLIKIQIQQAQQLRDLEYRRIDELTQYRKAKLAEVASFEASLKAITSFDVDKATEGKTPGEIRKIAQERQDAVSHITADIANLENTQLRISTLRSLEQLEFFEQQQIAAELQRATLRDEEEALKTKSERQKEIAKEVNDELKARIDLAQAIRTNARLLRTVQPDAAEIESGPRFFEMRLEDLQDRRVVALLLQNIENGSLRAEDLARYILAANEYAAQLSGESKVYLTNIAKALEGLQLHVKVLNTQIHQQKELNRLATTEASIRIQAASIEDRTKSASNKLIPESNATGGVAGYGRDTVPAMLTPGEFVVNSASSRKFYSQLVAMNSSNNAVAKMNAGGVTVGDINISMTSSGNENYDVQKLARGINREIRRGTVRIG